MRSMAMIGISLVLLAAIGFWLSPFSRGVTKASQAVPLVKALATPIKVRPHLPGGMPIYHLDKEIYDHLSGDARHPSTSQLTKETETPLSPEAIKHYVASSDDLSPREAPMARFNPRAYLVSLGTFRTHHEAETMWQHLRADHPQMLGEHHHDTHARHVADTGNFYLLRVGPFDNHASAYRFCKKIHEIVTECLVLQPGE